MCAFKKAAFGTFVLFTLSTTAFAQDSATTKLGDDCLAQFNALDVDGNGYLTDIEAPREYARSRIDDMTPQESGISADDFSSQCADENWAQNTPEEGAPFDGANSFTTDQARDRAMAWNVTDVSSLALDDQGIWRGTGKHDGADVDVAVDYKGNVVTTPHS